MVSDASLRAQFVPCEQVDATVQEDERYLATPPPGVSHSTLLVNLSRSLRSRHRCRGPAAPAGDLDRAIDCLTGALEELPPAVPGRLLVSSELADSLVQRGRVGDLDRATRIAREVVAAMAPGSADRAMALASLAAVLYAGINRTLDRVTLDEVIRLNREAVELLPAGHSQGPTIRLNMAIALVGRSQLGTHPADLRQSLAMVEELAGDPAGRALLGGPEGRAVLRQLRNFAAVRGEDCTLIDRLLVGGGPADSELPETLPPAVRRALDLDAEATTRMLDYQRTGRQQYLHDAVERGREAAALVPADYQLVRFRTRMNRATVRYIRYLALRDPEDLEEALRDARSLLPESPDDTERAAVTAAVAACLMQRFRSDPVGQETAMRQAVADLETVVDLVASGSVVASGLTSTLADALLARALVDRSEADAERAVDLFEAVRRTEPAGSLLAAGVDLVLADALSTRATLTGRPDHVQAATSALRDACRAGQSATVPNAFEAAEAWGRWAWDRQAWAEAGEAFGIAVRILHRLSGVQLDRSQAEVTLRRGANAGLAAKAAYALVRAGGPERLTQAAVALETGRALLLSDALERDRFDVDRLAAEGHAGLAAGYRQAAAEVAALERTWLAAPIDAHRAGTAEGLERTRAVFDEVIERIRELPAHRDFLRPPDIDTLRAVAGQEPLVYLAATDAGGVALVVHGGRQVGVMLPDLTTPALDARVRELLAIVDNDPEARERFDAVAEWMWDAVMEPVVELVVDHGAAMLIPSGRLGFLPLHAAGIRTPFGGWRYALDRVVFRYAPNARSLAAARAAADLPPTPVLGVTDPRNDLPAARAEVASLIDVFPRTMVTPLAGSQATRAAVWERLHSHRTLYFACHGTARPDPLGSALLLSDGEITLRDMLQERLPGARLAVLSVCESGRVGAELPDEVVALSTGLLQAGAAGVVASLWKVADESTAVLLDRFLHLWQREGRPLAAALCEAQRDVRSRVDPTHWAAFTYVGA